jgi:hypothetical protein
MDSPCKEQTRGSLSSIGASNDAGGPYYLPANSGNLGINLPDYSLDPANTAPLCARFASTIVPEFQCGELAGVLQPLYQQEALFSARDTNELFWELESPEFVFGPFGCNWTENSNGCVQQADSDWKQQVGKSYLPRVLTIPYPAQATTPRITLPNVPTPLGGYLWNTGDLSESDFWPATGAAPGGPAVEPTGASSIKTISVVQHGYCSQYLPLSTGIYQNLADQLWAQYLSQIQAADICSCIDIGRDFIHLSPFSEAPENTSTDQTGGFFLNAAFRNHFVGSGYLGFTDDSARANAAYQWRLSNEGGVVSDMAAYPPRHLDGRPLPAPLYSQYSADGHDGEVLDETLSSAIASQIPEAIYQSADQGLVYTGPSVAVDGVATFCPGGDPDRV